MIAARLRVLVETEDSVNNKLFMNTRLNKLSIENKQVEVYCEIILSRTDCKSKLDQQCTKKCFCVLNLNKKYVAKLLFLNINNVFGY